MLTLVLMVAGAVAVAVWAYLLLARGGFWRATRQTARGWRAAEAGLVTGSMGAFTPSRGTPACGDGPGAKAGRETVAAIIPARDEAEVIARSLSSLLGPSPGFDVRVFVVDDASSDGTADIARATAAKADRTEALTVILGRPLAPGWSGKLWAVQQGIVAAREFEPRFFLLTDADVVHSRDDLWALMDVAQKGGFDLASLMVRLRCESIAEKLLIPAFVFFFFGLYPPKWIASPGHQIAGAAGGCMLVRPEALERAGGLEAIRNQVIDDCALARAVKRSGGKVWLGLAAESTSIRPYHSFGEIGRMISRTAFNQLRHSAWLLLLVMAGMVLTYLLPVGLVFARKALLAELGLAAWGLMTVAYWPTVRYYRLSLGWALSLPLAALFYAGATVHSAVKYWLGRGGEWKGRVQDPTHS